MKPALPSPDAQLHSSWHIVEAQAWRSQRQLRALSVAATPAPALPREGRPQATMRVVRGGAVVSQSDTASLRALVAQLQAQNAAMRGGL